MCVSDHHRNGGRVTPLYDAASATYSNNVDLSDEQPQTTEPKRVKKTKKRKNK